MFPTVHGILSGATAVANWYDGALAAYQPKGAASYAASLIDLSGNGNDATEGITPSWASGTGWSFNGTTQHLITPVTPDSRNWTYLIAFDSVTFAGGEKTLFGNRQEAPSRRIIWIQPYPASLTVRQYRNGGGAQTNVASAVNGGVIGIAGTTTYYNGAADGVISSPDIYADVPLYIGAYNFNGAASGFTDGKIQAVGIWNTTLDAATVAEKSALMAAL